MTAGGRTFLGACLHRIVLRAYFRGLHFTFILAGRISLAGVDCLRGHDRLAYRCRYRCLLASCRLYVPRCLPSYITCLAVLSRYTFSRYSRQRQAVAVKRAYTLRS